jgi:hypothetical protein
MRSIYRKVLVVCAAVLVFGALASASASAAEWHVGGKALTGSAALAKATKVEESITLDFVAIETKVTCSGATLYGEGKKGLPMIVAPISLTMEDLVLEGCKVTNNANCSTPTSLATEPLELKLSTGTAPEDKAELKTPAKVLFTITFEGTRCVAAGEQSIDGKFMLKVPTGQEELAEQAFVAQGSKESPAGTEWLAAPVYLSGKLKLKLASGSDWSFH